MIITGAMFYFLVFSPKSEEIQIKEDELVAAEGEELQLRARVAELRRIEARLVEYRDAVNQMTTSVPPDPEMDLLILELNQLAVDSGVEWSSGSWTVPAAPSETGVRSISLTVTIDGQYFEVLGYLYGISEMDRLIRVEALSFTPSLTDDGFNVLSVNVTATTFTTGAVVIPEPPAEEAEEDAPEATTTTTLAGNEESFDTTTTTAGS